ncbi:hypothetical protein SAY86_017669 [Trapa natans]|uniref:STAS domain-containing protein n=1 Tax=Trapa natans TaxID=22666 RepID=A0AAN7LQK6_TRANT|nr:hypothetical protein SAY86_017669 [Trapa natans]
MALGDQNSLPLKMMGTGLEGSTEPAQLQEFSQTLQTHTAMAADPVSLDLEDQQVPPAVRALWVLDAPEPPSLWRELMGSVREIALPCGKRPPRSMKASSSSGRVGAILKGVFPVFKWIREYKLAQFKNDLMAGLTLASLCIPQSIGYATLARLDPEYGLYTSVLPPLIYAVMGTSKEIAIGPVAVVSMLTSSMIQKVVDPTADPIGYRGLVFTATFFAGVFQASFGIFRLGFLVDLLSHAAVVGFMAGAAIVIGFQQLKGLLGISHFTNRTDVVSVMESVWRSIPNSWNPHNFMLGCAFLSFLLIARFLGRKNKKLFWLPAIAPLLSVVLATLFVFLTRADKHGVKIIKHLKGGLNPSSIHELQFHTPFLGEAAKAGLVIAVIALTEAIAVGRSFASLKGYRLDGNKEMVAMGFMNIAGSFASCYTSTGSFSRTAVNFSAGCESPLSNVVMATAVLITLVLLTRLLYYTPMAILASIILAALPGLIDLNEARSIWRTDKLDFLACAGAFVGVLFGSVEIGLLVALAISFARIVLASINPGVETLGRVPGTETFCNIQQYPMATRVPGVLTIGVKSSTLCFANANFIQERIVKSVLEAEEPCSMDGSLQVQFVILDMSNLMNIDTSGIHSLEELNKNLASYGVELVMANPKWPVIHKLRVSKLTSKIGGRVFLTVKEAMDSCLATKLASL